MRSTPVAVGVGSDPVVQAMVKKQLEVRECLPRASNGHLAPSHPQAAQILKDMRQGTSKEFARLYRVGTCNLDDGVPLELAEAPILMLLTALRVHAADHTRPRTGRSLMAVMRHETRCQSTLDLAQLRLAESPTSVAALESVLAEAEHYTAPLEALKATVREQLTVIRATPAQSTPVQQTPARRDHMQVMR